MRLPYVKHNMFLGFGKTYHVIKTCQTQYLILQDLSERYL